MFALSVQAAELPPLKRAGMAWDNDGSGPDPFVRLYVNGRLLWESGVLQNTHTPKWDEGPPHNLEFPAGTRLRLEILDHDGPLAPELMGVVNRLELPEGEKSPSPLRWLLEDRGVLIVRIAHPNAHFGVGLTVELHPDALWVTKVLPRSPAARAGIQVGTRITAINGTTVGEMSEEEAFSRLSLASDQRSTLTLEDTGGPQRTVTLDRSPLWLTM